MYPLTTLATQPDFQRNTKLIDNYAVTVRHHWLLTEAHPHQPRSPVIIYMYKAKSRVLRCIIGCTGSGRIGNSITCARYMTETVRCSEIFVGIGIREKLTNLHVKTTSDFLFHDSAVAEAAWAR